MNSSPDGVPPLDDDDLYDLDEEERAALDVARQARAELVRDREQLIADGIDADAMIAEMDALFAAFARDHRKVREAEETHLQASADLTDHAAKVAYDCVRFVMELEKRWPALRGTNGPDADAKAEALLDDWQENRQRWLELLTAEQRRELGV